MDQNVFFSCCDQAVARLSDNIDTLTARYVELSDSTDCYTDVVNPLLQQQIAILTLMKDALKL